MTRRCVGCKHHSKYRFDGDWLVLRLLQRAFNGGDYCRKFSDVDLVTGETKNGCCTMRRHRDGECGVLGRGFAPIEKT